MGNIFFVDCDEELDSVVSSVINKYTERAKIGKAKYGKTLDRKDLNIDEWLTHLQEELMDATLYIEKVKQELIEVKKELHESINDINR